MSSGLHLFRGQATVFGEQPRQPSQSLVPDRKDSSREGWIVQQPYDAQTTTTGSAAIPALRRPCQVPVTCGMPECQADAASLHCIPVSPEVRQRKQRHQELWKGLHSSCEGACTESNWL